MSSDAKQGLELGSYNLIQEQYLLVMAATISSKPSLEVKLEKTNSNSRAYFSIELGLERRSRQSISSVKRYDGYSLAGM